jgi:hypothetical protein
MYTASKSEAMADLTDIVIGTSAEVFMAVVAAGAIYRIWGRALGLPQRNKVLPFQRGVLMKGEEPDRVLEAGSYWVSPKRTIFLCDMRPKPFHASGLEALSADGRWMRISLKGETTVSDPARYVTVSEPRATFYGDVRQAVHEAVGKERSGFLVGDRTALAASLELAFASYAEPLGLKVSKLEVWESMALGWHQVDASPDADLPLLQ